MLSFILVWVEVVMLWLEVHGKPLAIGGAAVVACAAFTLALMVCLVKGLTWVVGRMGYTS